MCCPSGSDNAVAQTMRDMESTFEFFEHERVELLAAGRGLVLLLREASDDLVDDALQTVDKETAKACIARDVLELHVEHVHRDQASVRQLAADKPRSAVEMWM